MQVANGCRVTVTCKVADELGNILDDGSKPMTFAWGRGEVIPGLEKALEGKEPGWQGKFELTPEEAYGFYRPELVFEAVRENLPEGMDIQPGMNLYPGGGEGRFQLKVLSITEFGAMLDGNHPLAGKQLSFEVEVGGVEPAA